MKLISHINTKVLYLEFREMVDCGISSNTIRCAKRDGTECWNFIDDPADKRKVLVHYESLKDKYKQLVQNRFGNPYKYIANGVIKQHLNNNETDAAYISNYQLPNGKNLPQNKIDEYIYACKYLNLLHKTDLKAARMLGFDTMRTFTDGVIAIISAEQIQLPKTYSRLKEKVREYAERGAECIVSGKFGNTNGNKINEQTVQLLNQLYGRHNNYSVEQVTKDFNLCADKLGLDKVTTSAARYILSKGDKQKQLVAQRNGLGLHRDSFDLVIPREGASTPLYFISIDGKSPYELYYQERVVNKKGHEQQIYWKRKTVIVIIDAYNCYPLGYHICNEETIDNIKLALKAAVDHVFELTGEYHLPHQLQSDRFGYKELERVYNRIATYVTPAQARNARSKPIEAYFRRHDVKYVQPNFNWSGIGITGKKKNQANRDFLDKIKQNFPNEQGVELQIHANFAKERADKREEWLKGWNEASNKRKFSRMNYLEVFGKTTGYTNRLTNKGIVTTINGETRNYMLLDHAFYNTIGTDYTVYYDERDLNTVLVMDKDGRRKYVLPEFEKQPMALKDRKDGDAEKLQKLLEFKKEEQRLIIEKNKQEMEYVVNTLDAEALIKFFPTINGANKELVNKAKLVAKGDMYDEDMSDTMPVSKPPIQEDDVYDL